MRTRCRGKECTGLRRDERCEVCGIRTAFNDNLADLYNKLSHEKRPSLINTWKNTTQSNIQLDFLQQTHNSKSTTKTYS